VLEWFALEVGLYFSFMSSLVLGYLWFVCRNISLDYVEVICVVLFVW
jgi:hypothetical protein